ncbi:MAG TPA: signal peptidase II [Acidimicrobiales bacterium]
MEAESPSPPQSRRIGTIAAVAVAVVAVDQLSKWWAVRRLPRGEIHVVSSLHLNLAFNTGTAFSLGSGKGLGPWISVLAFAVVAVLLASASTARHTVGAVAAGLVAGGAIGNVADRAFRGHAGFLHGAVVDFIDLRWWPIFNLADSAIVVGTILFALATLRTPPS